MEYSVLNNYLYEDKAAFLKACDWLSHPLRTVLQGKTIDCCSSRERQDSRVQAIAICCLVIPVLVGAVSLLLKYISREVEIINSLAERTQGVYQENPTFRSNASLFLSDQPFTNPYFPLLIGPPSEQMSPISERFVQDFINHLFEEFHQEQPSTVVDIEVGDDGELYVTQDLIRHSLKRVVECIDWGNLDERWGGLDRESTQFYIQKSLLFERLREPSLGLDSPFNRDYPFIRLYTSYGFYSIVNPIIREGKLRDGRLFFASQETNDRLSQGIPEVVGQVAKEVLFVSLMMSASLCNLPGQYLERGRAVRTAHIPLFSLEMMNEGQVISERGFMSASAGGGYAGGGPCNTSSCRVRYVVLSRNGKRVSEFSDLRENEVLFRPFSQFRISRRSGDLVSGFRIEMEEI